VDAAEKQRGEIQKKIAKLDGERKKYVAARRKQLPPATNTLDEAIIAAVREAGRKRGFTF
ncbi:MAG TPA: VWA domain-containing protein, partial [Thermoanaerobaculia bacterium]|nr:VWA domain-containing protein [Thermoanaerobaculia bacterium]